VKIGVISDTHGNLKLMHAAADWLLGTGKVELLYHLGDDYTDAVELGYTGARILKVPGLWCAAYRDGRTAKVLINEHAGVGIACCHADEDITPLMRASDIVMTGHTHVAFAERRGGTIYMNPGHLKSKLDRGQLPSFAVIDIQPKSIDVRIHELTGALRLERQFSRETKGTTETTTL